eukprot:1160277-Pelagomonas_calceolata.AAC.27
MACSSVTAVHPLQPQEGCPPCKQGTACRANAEQGGHVGNLESCSRKRAQQGACECSGFAILAIQGCDKLRTHIGACALPSQHLEQDP